MLPTVLLDEKVVIVTGGSRGIGRAVSLGMAREGASVVVVGREQAPIDEVVQAIAEQGSRPALGVAADVSDEASVRRMVQATLDRYGRVDVLAMLHGVISPARFLDISFEQWQRVLGINLNGTFLCMQAVLPHMLEHGGTGKIITTTSLPGMRAVGGTDYGVSKAAIIALTQMVARELRSQGARISVNCVSPVAETRMSEALANFRGQTMEQFRAARIGGEMPTAEEIVPTYVFLASEGANQVTGQVIAADGGRSV